MATHPKPIKFALELFFCIANQTKIDDILMEMISPKIKEIEGRFSKGEGLSNDDINTLLLKSQFNHINHLD